MIRIAAVGDLHVGRDTPRLDAARFARMSECADVLLLAGDLTQHGYAEEAAVLAGLLCAADVPIVAVLGNHDYHQGQQQQIREELERARVHVLEGESLVIAVGSTRLGVAGVKGFGGGFAGACGTEFGEEEMKTFIRHSRLIAERLKRTLFELDCEMKVALTHYSPARGTLLGEPLEIYPFLGSYFLGEAIDTSGCAAAFHGHAHSGSERALTPAGVPVRNVARPVIKLAYKIYTLRERARLEDAPNAFLEPAPFASS